MHRALLAAAALLSATGCCLDIAADDACVVDRPPERPFCHSITNEALVCTNDVEPSPSLVVDLRTCEGTLNRGVSCEDRGFTQRCAGDFFVRAGDGC